MTRMRDQFRPRLLSTLVDYQLLNELAKENGLSVTDEEVAARLEREVQDTILLRGITRDELDQQVRSQMGLSLDEAMVDRKADPFYRDMVVHTKLLQQKYPEDTAVTDEEIQQAYDAMKARFSKPEEVRASHILVNTTQLETDDEKDEAREKLVALLAKVNEGGDFGELAKEHSDCPSGERSQGDLGFFPRTGKMVEPFAEAAFNLEVGQVSDIVETQFGYHIIKVTDRRAARTTTLEEAKQAMFDQVLSQKLAKVRTQLLTELKDKGAIEYAEGMEPPAPRRPVLTTQPAPPRAPAQEGASSSPGTAKPPATTQPAQSRPE
jgi:peptidyl-prolyl cis-trans isomerase C